MKQTGKLLVAQLLLIAAIIAAGVMFAVYHPLVKLEEVGRVHVQDYGPWTGYTVFTDSENGNPAWCELPMWVQNDRQGKPMWGYVLVNETSSIQYLKQVLGMELIPFGNFADQKYLNNRVLAPFYAGDTNYWDPIKRDYVSTEPKKFFVIVSLSKKT
ncbi:MAG: hypothetical protein AAB610_00020 [Patescibacteria group bacterium]